MSRIVSTTNNLFVFHAQVYGPHGYAGKMLRITKYTGNFRENEPRKDLKNQSERTNGTKAKRTYESDKKSLKFWPFENFRKWKQ